MFTEEEVRLLLLLVKEKYCPQGGYADDPMVSKLQHKLSIHLQMAQTVALNSQLGPKGQG